jgi:6-phosphogluconolactonase
MTTTTKVINVSNTIDESMKEFVDYLREIIIQQLNDNDKDFITIGLSGGSQIKQLSKELINQKQSFQQFVHKLRFIFCDERFVPLNHEDSTFNGYMREHLFEELGVSNEHVYTINASSSTVEECAVDYEQRLRTLLNKQTNAFDILILGMGPDGHTCSLFPGHALFTERDRRLVAPIRDSPKSPPQRVTLTLEYINKSKYVLFSTYGDSKAEIIKRILRDHDQTLPSGCVAPSGTLKWFIDAPAAKLL